MKLEEPLIFALGEIEDKIFSFEEDSQTKREELLNEPEREDQWKKELEYNLWYQDEYCEILDLFEKRVYELDEEEIYYYGCSSKVYKQTYYTRLNNFISEYEDAEEIDFIEEELENGILKIPYKYLKIGIQKKIKFGLNKRFKFLQERAYENDYKIEYYEPVFDEDKESFQLKNQIKESSTNIKWHGSQTELIELVKALIEAKRIRGTQKSIINTISNFFGVQINHPNKLIQDIKNRNLDSETKFLNELKEVLSNYIKRENTRY